LALLLAVHLGTNFKAVTAVALRTLNRQRTNIACSTFYDTGKVLAPREVAQQERIFEMDGVLRWRDTTIGDAQIGAKLAALAESLQSPHSNMGGVSVTLTQLVGVFRDEKHLLWYDYAKRRVTVCLKEGVDTEGKLKAWMHALLLAQQIHQGRVNSVGSSHQELLGVVKHTLDHIGVSWGSMAQRLREAGWDLDTAVLETVPGYRIDVCSTEITGAGKDKGSGAPVEWDDEAKKDI